MIKLQYYGKTCFSFLNDDVNVLINPDFTNNEENFKNLDQIKADVIVLTKYKEDLISDVVSIAKHNNATIVCACALADKLRNFGIADDKLIRACVGQRINFENKVDIHFIQSIANSNLPGTLAMGAIITLDAIKIYHDGLTAYYSDLKLLRDCNIDYALISVSEWGSKNITDAKKVIEDIKPKFFIPMHYLEVEKPQIIAFKELIANDIKQTIPVILTANSGIIINK